MLSCSNCFKYLVKDKVGFKGGEAGGVIEGGVLVSKIGSFSLGFLNFSICSFQGELL